MGASTGIGKALAINYARLNKIDDKTLTLDNGKIHKSFESVFLEDGVYNVHNDISKTIVVTKGTFNSKISLDGQLNTYYYNNVLKGYTTNDTATDKFIIILNWIVLIEFLLHFIVNLEII